MRKKLSDGSLEDQLDSALTVLAQLQAGQKQLENNLRVTTERLNTEMLRNTALFDLLQVVLEIPIEALDAAYANASVFALQPIKGNPVAKALSRQAALRRKIAKMEEGGSEDGELHST